jgi:antitoxin (DNA-binding transcriptional repressor) of toxin-antitoxin stability system
MKLVGSRDVKIGLAQVLSDAQRDAVLITNHGHPVALVLGVHGMPSDTQVFSELNEIVIQPWNSWIAIRNAAKKSRTAVGEPETRRERLQKRPAKEGSRRAPSATRKGSSAKGRTDGRR